MKKTILTLLTLVITGIASVSYAQKFKWAKTFTSDSLHNRTNAVVIRNGITYSTGYYTGTAKFGNGITLVSTKVGIYYSMDMFIAAHDANGSCLWARSIGTYDPSESGTGICKTANNYLYVTGSTNNLGNTSGKLYKVDISTSTPVITEIATLGKNLTCVASDGVNAFVGGHDGTNALVAKFNPSGTLLGSNISTSSVTGSTVTAITYAQGYFYTTGVFEVDLSFNNNTVSVPAENGKDVFVARFNYTTLQNTWIRSAGGAGAPIGNKLTNEDVGRGIYATYGDIYVCGSFKNTATFGTATITSIGQYTTDNGFLAKYNTLGNLVWVNPINSTGNVLGFSVSGSPYGVYAGFSGSSTITAVSTSGNPNVTVNNSSIHQNSDHIVKYSTSGQALWASSVINNGLSPVCVNAVANSATCAEVVVGGEIGNLEFKKAIFTPALTSTSITINSIPKNMATDAYVASICDCFITPTTCGQVSGMVMANDNLIETQSINTTRETEEGEELINDAFNVVVYPNPSNGIYNINAKGIFDGSMQVTVINVLGAVVYTANITSEQVNSATIDLSTEPKGTYFMQINYNGEAKNIKLINQ